jgi:pyruvate-formate lyase-activating enzyme
LHTLKEHGYLAKLDSNGLLPEMLEKCTPHLDYIAVDMKTSPELYLKLKA